MGTVIVDSNLAHIARLKRIVSQTSSLCGVYIWKDKNKTILYIGKAINLKARLASYFHSTSIKTKSLIAHAWTIDCIVVNNEYEALILEHNLIKEFSPPYNIQFKDQKTYPLIRLTNEEYPTFIKTRQKVDDGSIYYGPYPDSKHVDQFFKIIAQFSKIRQCKTPRLRKRKTPCLYHFTHQCLAPCCFVVDRSRYMHEIQKGQDILHGNVQAINQSLTQAMREASAKQEYELAAKYRNLIGDIKLFTEEQLVQDDIGLSRDYVSYVGDNSCYYFVILSMRQGKMVGKTSLHFEALGDEQETLDEFLLSYYGNHNKSVLPSVVYVENLREAAPLEQFFKDTMQANIRFRPPIEQRDLSLLHMALNNASLDLSHTTYLDGSLTILKDVLGLTHLPNHIEGFDIAQLDGHFTVASLVTFINGQPDYKNYRTFQIKSLANGEIDDFQSLREAVTRRFTRLLNEDLPLPDLLLIDGGKGQISAVLSVLKALGLEKKITLVGLAKQNEELYLPYRTEPIVLEKDNPALRLCQAIRDETHRVATTHNKKLRSKTIGLNQLESLPGIGSKKAKALLQHFGSLQDISHQTPENIAKVAKISKNKAQIILEELQKLL